MRLLRERAALALTPEQYDELLRILPGNPYFLTCAAQQFDATTSIPSGCSRLLRLQPDLIAEDYPQVGAGDLRLRLRADDRVQRRLLSVLVNLRGPLVRPRLGGRRGRGRSAGRCRSVPSRTLGRWCGRTRFPRRFFIHPLTRYCAEKVLRRVSSGKAAGRWCGTFSGWWRRPGGRAGWGR